MGTSSRSRVNKWIRAARYMHPAVKQVQYEFYCLTDRQTDQTDQAYRQTNRFSDSFYS